MFKIVLSLAISVILTIPLPRHLSNSLAIWRDELVDMWSFIWSPESTGGGIVVTLHHIRWRSKHLWEGCVEYCFIWQPICRNWYQSNPLLLFLRINVSFKYFYQYSAFGRYLAWYTVVDSVELIYLLPTCLYFLLLLFVSLIACAMNGISDVYIFVVCILKLKYRAMCPC